MFKSRRRTTDVVRVDTNMLYAIKRCTNADSLEYVSSAS
ncbi:protein of unknown function [Bradyrhizobium vignae]|uniref:Uncharacterized protein n=1 Tax=Bradyrhizobium vignae TaxID=1549949 RepID=A0A2U3PTK5_9BRAD|nr:protein of unknown function [Bradyrhizobium vignae]